MKYLMIIMFYLLNQVACATEYYSKIGYPSCINIVSKYDVTLIGESSLADQEATLIKQCRLTFPKLMKLLEARLKLNKIAGARETKEAIEQRVEQQAAKIKMLFHGYDEYLSRWETKNNDDYANKHLKLSDKLNLTPNTPDGDLWLGMGRPYQQNHSIIVTFDIENVSAIKITDMNALAKKCGEKKTENLLFLKFNPDSNVKKIITKITRPCNDKSIVRFKLMIRGLNKKTIYRYITLYARVVTSNEGKAPSIY